MRTHSRPSAVGGAHTRPCLGTGDVPGASLRPLGCPRAAIPYCAACGAFGDAGRR